MVNNIMEFLADVPPTLAAAWAVWFGAGVLLTMWYRKAEANLAVQPAVAPRALARAKSDPRPAAEARPTLEPRPVAVARPRPSPIVVGDPFGDLATLLDQSMEAAATTAPAPAPVFRAPAESPILNSAGSPVLRINDNDQKF